MPLPSKFTTEHGIMTPRQIRVSGIVSRINQGGCDSEQSLLNLRDNATNKNRIDVFESVSQDEERGANYSRK